MTTEIMLIMSVFGAVLAVAFAIAAVVWLRKLRGGVVASLGEAVVQQISSLQRMGEIINQLQKQQQAQEQQIHGLIASSLKTRMEIAAIANRMDIVERDGEGSQATENRTLH